MKVISKEKEITQYEQINHIAIIMDGNGRWGLKKYNSRKLGHKQV